MTKMFCDQCGCELSPGLRREEFKKVITTPNGVNHEITFKIHFPGKGYAGDFCENCLLDITYMFDTRTKPEDDPPYKRKGVRMLGSGKKT